MGPDTPAPAFRQIVEELSEPLLRYLQRHGVHGAVADDLLQETLIRISRGLSGFAGRASVKTWAFSIATRVAADHFRQPANRVRVVEFEDTPEAAEAADEPEQRLVVNEMNDCIRSVIDTLPADYRSALILHDLEGLSSPDIAEICGCSVATAKIRIHRARLRLKEAMQQACDFYRDRDNVLRCDRKSGRP